MCHYSVYFITMIVKGQRNELFVKIRLDLCAPFVDVKLKDKCSLWITYFYCDEKICTEPKALNHLLYFCTAD